MLDYVTTIISQPDSLNLVDLAGVKLELDITDTKLDVWLQTKIDNMSAAVQDYCNRKFVQQVVQDMIFFDHNPLPGSIRSGVQPLQLSHWPIISVASVVVEEPGNPVNPVTIDPSHYVVDTKKGQLVRVSTRTGFERYWRGNTTTVIYTSGYAAIPFTVVEATLKMVTKAYWKRGQDPSLKAREQQTGREEFWISSKSEGNMTPDIQDLLDNFRVPIVG